MRVLILCVMLSCSGCALIELTCDLATGAHEDCDFT
jgi:hypothetical protein